MKAIDFFDLTKRTRAAQKLYFTSRLQGDLITAKRLERDLDNAIAAGLDVPASAEQQTNMAEQKPLFTETNNEQTEGH